jgi:hypothetical protein
VRRRYIAAAAVVVVGAGLGSFAFLSPARAASPTDEITSVYNGNTYGTGTDGTCNAAASGGTCQETASCPSGDYASGGGFTTYANSGSVPASDLVPLMSQPYPASAGTDLDTGWIVEMKNTGSATESFQAWVMCLEGAS